jgi:formate dehydrogenase major subunit
VPGLGARLGRGAATTPQQDLANSDCVVIMGSNMAENHPVGFRFVMKAKTRGATVIHVDPRFGRTSAMADLHVPLRAGSDLVLLGALINYVIQNGKYFHDYVVHYTNAAVLVNPQFQDTEDLGGLFSGYDPHKRTYATGTWQYEGRDEKPVGGATDEDTQATQTAEPSTQRSGGDGSPPSDPTLQHPCCVFQIVRRHYARYTPAMVEQMCGIPQTLFERFARAITDNSNPERTTAFCYAVAWTQHTTGSQMIGACALLQLLLGNIGRPGGGIIALRGHTSIQGSTDIPTLYNLLPGYLPMPSADRKHATLRDYLDAETPRKGWWSNTPKYMVSLLKAWYGDAARPDNDFAYDLLPKIGGDYSFQPMLLMMKDGSMKGLFCLGQNPAVGGINAVLAREALQNLDWLVVRDIHEIETAAFWYDAPEVRDGSVRPQDINTEVFLLPASIAAEKEGTVTNTQRLIQWHDKAVDPPGDARSDAWFIHDLAVRLKALYKDDTSPLGRQINALRWEYPMKGDPAEPDLDVVDHEINGYAVADGKQVKSFTELRDDGSTACGCWIYSGMVPEAGRNLARGREGDDGAALGWGFAWPANRRILYNRASADPSGKPWSERKKWIWWDAEQRTWTGYDEPDFPVDKPPDYQPAPDALGMDAIAGDAPFVMMGEGKGLLFTPTGMHDGPLPTHYEPSETTSRNQLYPSQQHNPVAVRFPRPDNPYHVTGDPRYPYVVTTYRLTEHHTAGGMSRWTPWLAELQPEGFAEISTELAREHGIANGDWVTLTTERGAISTRALVTDRLQPLQVDGRTMHQIGVPYHFGWGGLARGGIANDLSVLVEDPNSRIHQAKAFTCGLRKGRMEGQPVTDTDQPRDEATA